MFAASLCKPDPGLVAIRPGDGRRSPPRRHHGRHRAGAFWRPRRRASRSWASRWAAISRYAIMRAAPERVTRLALLDTGCARRPAGAIRAPQSSRSSSRGPGASRRFPRRSGRSSCTRTRQGDAALKKIVLQMAQDTGAEAFIRQQTAIMTRPDSRPDLPKIKCPTLVLVGDGDQLTPPKLSEEIAAGIPNSRLVIIAGLRPSLHARAPDAVNKALVEWMSAERHDKRHRPHRRDAACRGHAARYRSVQAVSQTRKRKSVGLDQGSSGARDDRSGGSRRPAEIRRHDRRGDGGQYRAWVLLLSARRKAIARS